jgi:Undecaprenyl-phosphate glucose phosphotransferase
MPVTSFCGWFSGNLLKHAESNVMNSAVWRVGAPRNVPLGLRLHSGGTRVPPVSRWAFVAVTQVLEAMVVMLTSLLALAAAPRHPPFDVPELAVCLGAIFLLVVVVPCVFRAIGGYDLHLLLRPGASVLAALLAWCVAAGPVVLCSILYNPNEEYAPAWGLGWFAGTFAILAGLRLALALVGRRCREVGVLGHSVCVVGTSQQAALCIEQADADDSGIAVLGMFSYGVEGDDGWSHAHVVPRLGTLAEIPAFLRENRVDEIIVAVDPDDGACIRDIVQQLRCLPVKVLISFGIGNHVGSSPGGGACGGTRLGNMLLMPAVAKPLDGWLWVLKDVQDRLLALVALFLFAPLAAVIALAIRLSSPGPILFKQVRQGYNGTEFQIWKFRTMHVGSAAEAGSLALTRRGDPRVFSVGALLRRSSMDELPQLLNVLLGDMWLIGPRPHSPLASVANRRYCDAVTDYASRHRVKPGITGWAQVNGWRGPTETVEQIRQRVEHDIYYIDNWSMLLDARILWRTMLHGFVHGNAF